VKTEYPPTPELDKMKAVHEKSQAIGEFIDVFLSEKHIVLCESHPTEGYFPVTTSIERLLAEHFGIDLNKCESERRAILKHIRQENTKPNERKGK
jgi:hypothetical protein